MKPTKDEIVHLLQTYIPNVNILNIYSWGSQFLNTHTPTSDYDYIIIVETLDRDNWLVPLTEDIDAYVFSLDCWKLYLELHVIWVMQFIGYPDSGTLLKTVDFDDAKIYLHILKRAVLVNNSVNVRQAKAFVRDGYVDKAKKRIRHVLRLMVYACDIARYGHVRDYFAANDYELELNKLCCDGWEDLEAWFEPILERLVGVFKAYCTHYISFYAENKDGAIVEYMKQRSISEVERLGVSVTEYDTLVHLNRVFLQAFDRECLPLVLDTVNYKVVAKGCDKIWPYGDEHNMSEIDKVNLDTAKVYYRCNGLLILLYWYNDEWCLCTRNTLDGSDVIFDSTAKEIFWHCVETNNFVLPVDKNICYRFNIISKDGFIFHSAYDLNRNCELDINLLTVPFPKNAVLSSYPNDLQDLQSLSIANNENYIICDDKFNRCSILHPILFLFDSLEHETIDLRKDLKILDIVAKYTPNPLFEFVPDKYKQRYTRINSLWIQYCDSVQDYFNEKIDTDNRTLSTESSPYKFYVFRMRKLNVHNVYNFFNIEADTLLVGNVLSRWWKREHAQDGAYKKAFCFK